MKAQSAAQTKWGTWLQPHRLNLLPTPPLRPARRMAIALPKQWSEQRRRCTMQVENLLLTIPALRHLSVVPRECVYFMDHTEGRASQQPTQTLEA